MTKFPVDVPRHKVIATFELLGFRLAKEGAHIAMVRENPDGTRTPLTISNHRRLKGSTLRDICTQAGIPREEFISAYEQFWNLDRAAASLPCRTVHGHGAPETPYGKVW